MATLPPSNAARLAKTHPAPSLDIYRNCQLRESTLSLNKPLFVAVLPTPYARGLMALGERMLYKGGLMLRDRRIGYSLGSCTTG